MPIARRRRYLTAAALLAVVTLLIARCGGGGGGRSGDAEGGGPTPPAATSTKGLPSKLARNLEQANQIVGEGREAFEQRLRALRGHPVVVNQWASSARGVGEEGVELAEQPLARVVAEVDLEEDEPAASGVGAGGAVDGIRAVAVPSRPGAGSRCSGSSLAPSQSPTRLVAIWCGIDVSLSLALKRRPSKCSCASERRVSAALAAAPRV